MKATLIDHMGSDLSVVNAARVSFGKKSEWERFAPDSEWKRLSKSDQGLIQFLARGCTSGDWDELVESVGSLSWLDGDYAEIKEELKDLLNHIRRMPPHWSPFAHTAVSLHLKMPIFVARQIMKHTTGMVYNEVSRRYVTDEPEFYVPDAWRKAADNVKQGSSDETVDSLEWLSEHNGQDCMVSWDMNDLTQHYIETGVETYNRMVDGGIAPEQARMVLPQSMYTEVIATGNLWSFCNLVQQRTDSHAQKETQDIARQIEGIIRPLFPVSTSAILD